MSRLWGARPRKEGARAAVSAQARGLAREWGRAGRVQEVDKEVPIWTLYNLLKFFLTAQL